MPVLTTLKMLGLAGLVSYAAAKFAAKAGLLGYHRYVLLAVPVAGMPAMPKGFTVRELSANDLERYPIDVSAEVQLWRFSQGMICLGAFNPKNDLVGVNWIGTQPFVEDEVHIRFAPPGGAAWDTGLWIKPQYRLGRGFAALWAGTAHWLSDQGCAWSMSRIADFNLPSLNAHKRMGGIATGTMIVFRVWKWQFSTDSRPKFARLWGKDAPTIALTTPKLLSGKWR